MPKAKYRIGSLAKFGNAQTGVITAVVTRKEGHSYHMDGHTQQLTVESELKHFPIEVSEDSISAVFREVKPRAAAKSRSSGSKPKKNKDEAASARQ